MYPISLHLDKLNVALVGSKGAIERRLNNLQKAYPNISPQLFQDKTPSSRELRKVNVIMIIDLPDLEGQKLYKRAKKYNILVNFEDKPDYCDFYFCSFMKRGDLGVAISTNGKSPALGVTLRKKLEELLPPVWETRLNDVSQKREGWKEKCSKLSEVNKLSKDYLAEKGWFDELGPKKKKRFKWFQ